MRPGVHAARVAVKLMAAAMVPGLLVPALKLQDFAARRADCAQAVVRGSRRCERCY